jgi:PTS system nitrogen regulatory IIA component
VRLSLYVPKAEVNHAIQRVALLVPAAQMGRVLEIPDAPTDAWRDVMHAEFQPRAEAQARPAEAAAEAYSIATLLSQDDVLLGLNIADRPALFAELGHFFEQRCGLPATTTTAALAAREELGSTALGLGVALPHGHIQSLNRPMAAYVCPADPIAFDAPDGQPVKDIIVLLVPEWGNSMHLHLLADVAQRFCDHHFREQLHACADVRAVSELFRGYQAREQALEKPPAKAPETRARSFRTQR